MTQHLATTFDQVAELYDRARPGYPDEILDDLAVLARLSPGARILEIGCGTGQATLPLAERGFDVLCVERGARLAAVARAKLGRFPGVEVVVAPFEEWDPAGRSFDAVVAFTAFHWLDPHDRYEKSAQLLRPRGSLGVVTTQHVLPEGGDLFFGDVQEDYLAVTGDDDGPPPLPDDVSDLSVEIRASGRFGEPHVRRYVWDVTYGPDDYIAVLDTYSGHRALDPDRRRRLYERIRRRIDAQPDRTVRKTYLAILHVAERQETE